MQTVGYEGSQLFSSVEVGGTVTEVCEEDFSQPIPSLSLSNLCGSGGKTLKLVNGISPQSKSGGDDGIHVSGYEGSQLLSFVCNDGVDG